MTIDARSAALPLPLTADRHGSGGQVLVTGASGFIGRALCEELQARGARVVAMMRNHARGPWQRQINVDLARGEVPRAALEGVDAVFHLAGRAHVMDELRQDDTEHHRVSAMATSALLDAAAAGGISTFVYVSSAAASTSSNDKEDPRVTTAVPGTAYGRAKLAAERLVLDAGDRHGMHVCNLRPVVVYGIGCKSNIPRMLEAIDRKRFPPVPEVGNVRSMVHVQDVVRAALLVASEERAGRSSYHVTDGRSYSTREIYVEMARALGVSVPGWSVPVPVFAGIARAGDAIGRARGRRFLFDTRALHTLLGNAYFDSSRIERELGFRATMSFEAALPGMVADYRLRRGRSGA